MLSYDVNVHDVNVQCISFSNTLIDLILLLKTNSPNITYFNYLSKREIHLGKRKMNNCFENEIIKFI